MMYYLMCGEFPFKGRNEPELYRAVCSGNVRRDTGFNCRGG